jgi:hypothetical protein
MTARKRLGFFQSKAGSRGQRLRHPGRKVGRGKGDLQREPLVHHIAVALPAGAEGVQLRRALPDVQQRRQRADRVGHVVGTGKGVTRRSAAIARVSSPSAAPCSARLPAACRRIGPRRRRARPAAAISAGSRGASRPASADNAARRAAWIAAGSGMPRRHGSPGQCRPRPAAQAPARGTPDQGCRQRQPRQRIQPGGRDRGPPSPWRPASSRASARPASQRLNGSVSCARRKARSALACALQHHRRREAAQDRRAPAAPPAPRSGSSASASVIPERSSAPPRRHSGSSRPTATGITLGPSAAGRGSAGSTWGRSACSCRPSRLSQASATFRRGVPASEYQRLNCAQIAAGGILEHLQPVLDRRRLPVVALEIEIQRPRDSPPRRPAVFSMPITSAPFS